MNSPSQIFLTMLIMVTDQLYIEEKLFVGASILYGSGYLFLL